jgi:mRNA cleavage and polyadenylation factor CLP1 P-loop
MMQHVTAMMQHASVMRRRFDFFLWFRLLKEMRNVITNNFLLEYIFCFVVSNNKINFSSNIKYDKSFYFGNVNVQLAPVKYIECLRNLLKHCHKQHRDIPWIVNTMEMVRGYGLELLVGIIKLARPSVLIIYVLLGERV